MLRSWWVWLLVCCWFGASLRFHGLFANTFHADEALFAGWARLIAVWRDPLLLTQAVDKPPLLFYLQALFYPLFGPVEWAARMPSLIVSLLMIPLTAELALRLAEDRLAALIAAGIMAVSPLAVQFSATAFSDPLLTFWLVVAIYGAIQPVRSRPERNFTPFLTGLLFGLALATKYQALLLAPLLIGLGWLTGWRGRDWLGALAGLAVMVAALMIWHAARPAAGGPVALQWANIGGLRPARSWELLPRLADIAKLWRLALGWTGFVLSAAAAIGIVLSGRPRDGFRFRPSVAMLASFVLGYALLHWLWAVPVWDRYWLPILPLMAILVGRGISALWLHARYRVNLRRAFVAFLIVISVAHVHLAAAAREGRFAIGGRPTADGGAASVAGLLKDAPYGTVLYDHWYSWHWGYQLFDGRVYVSWFPNADALLADLESFGGDEEDRYIALPAAAVSRPILRILRENGYRVESLPIQDGPQGVMLYRIVVEAASD